MNFDADDKKMLQVNILFLKKCQSDFCFMFFKFFKFMTYISENYHGYHKQFFFLLDNYSNVKFNNKEYYQWH